MKLSDAAIDVDRLENGAWVDNLHELFPELAGSAGQGPRCQQPRLAEAA